MDILFFVQPKGLGKNSKLSPCKKTGAIDYTVHLLFRVYSDDGLFFVVNFAEGQPNPDGTWKPSFDDHLSTALSGKERYGIQPDKKLYQALDKAGFSYPFHGNLCRSPEAGPDDYAVTKDVSSTKLNANEIPVQSFVFSLESNEEKSINDWCKILQDIIVPVCKKADDERIKSTALKNRPKYAPFHSEHNLGSELIDDKFRALDNGILDRNVKVYYHWTAKLVDNIVNENGDVTEPVSNSPWAATIYERHENLRSMFYTNWEKTGYNKLAVVEFGFPLNGKENYAQRCYCSQRVEHIQKAFGALTEDDHPETSGSLFAVPLVKSMITLLGSTVPQNMDKRTFTRLQSFRSGLNSCEFDISVELLQQFDAAMQGYEFAGKVQYVGYKTETTALTSDEEQEHQGLIGSGKRPLGRISPEGEGDGKKSNNKKKKPFVRAATVEKGDI